MAVHTVRRLAKSSVADPAGGQREELLAADPDHVSAALEHHADVVRVGLPRHERGPEVVGVRAVDHRAELEDPAALVLGGLQRHEQGGTFGYVETASIIGVRD